MTENNLTDLPEDDEDDVLVPYPSGRERKPRLRTRTRIEIVRELRIRDFNWKEIASRMGYASEKGIHRILRRAGVKIG